MKYRSTLKRGTLIYLSLLLPAVVLCLSACRESKWDPEVAALVGGRPILRSDLVKVMELGFNSRLGQGGEALAGEVTVNQTLSKLIDEKLILIEAEKAGLSVGEEELNETAAQLGSAWFDDSPPPAELMELRQTLHNQILLRKMTNRVIAENMVLSAEKWRLFWNDWPKDQPPRYLVRALLLPPTDNEPEVPVWRSYTLERLAGYYTRQGLEVIISDPLWLGAANMAEGAPEALKQAWARRKVTRALRLSESWVIYEIMEMEPAPTPAANFVAAKKAFEQQAAEDTFDSWLTKVRSRADIQVNPMFAEIKD